jgi:glycosyltransferase involved in cell wall biosynthesis
MKMIKKKKPMISVIMSVYNCEKYLSICIESILNQTFVDFEFIIVDDCSTDNSLSIIKKYSQFDPRIKVIKNKINLGFIKSLNKGLRIVLGKYIARIDGDDFSLPDRFLVQYNFLENNKEIFLVGTWAINIDKNGNKLSLHKPPTKPDKIKATLEKYNCMYHNTIMFRSTPKIFYREKMLFTEDNDFYLRCLTNNLKIANIPKFLVKYRRLPNSTSFSKKGLQSLFSLKARDFYYQRKKNGIDSYELFNPNTILSLNNSFTNPIFLEAEIESNFALNNLKKTKGLIRLFFKRFGLAKKKKFIIMFLLTFLKPNILKKMKKIILFIRGRY